MTLDATYYQDFYFMLIMLQLAVGFSIAFVFLKGMWWLAIMGGLSWILLGMGSMFRTEIFYFQRTLAIVFIVIGIGIIFLPAWYKRKQNKSMAEQSEEEDETGTYLKEMEDYEKPIRKLKSLGRRKRPYERS